MQTNEDILRQLWFSEGAPENRYDDDKIADWWLNKMNLQKQQMIEKGEGLVKTCFHESHSECLEDDCHIDEYNEAITDYQNLIKE